MCNYYLHSMAHNTRRHQLYGPLRVLLNVLLGIMCD